MYGPYGLCTTSLLPRVRTYLWYFFPSVLVITYDHYLTSTKPFLLIFGFQIFRFYFPTFLWGFYDQWDFPILFSLISINLPNVDVNPS